MRIWSILGALLVGACGAYVAVDETPAAADGSDSGHAGSVNTPACDCPAYQPPAPYVYADLDCATSLGLANADADWWAVAALQEAHIARAKLGHGYVLVGETMVLGKLALWSDDGQEYAAVQCGTADATAEIVIP